MGTLSTTFVILALVAAGFYLGVRKLAAWNDVAVVGRRHIPPGYYGAYVALWCGLPALLLVLAWVALEPVVIDYLVIASLPDGMTANASTAQIDLLKSQITNIASGRIFGTPEPALIAAAEDYKRFQSLAGYALFVAGISVALLGLGWARSHIDPRFGARLHVERITTVILIACSTIAILTTLGIVISLVLESLKFFAKVPVQDFLFGLNWEPQIPIREGQVAATGAFGAIPVFAGTILIAAIAMAIAIPVGLMSAIYMSEYAPDSTRKTVKPILEVLAGVPTIVYGFFAVLTVAPFLSEVGNSLGMDVAPNSALAAGGVMGIMIIPFISSLSDDALTAVPQSLRDGAAALGATQAETIKQVLLPAALPGIMGGVLLAVSRAIGETMIVVMAAGLAANMTANPFEAVTTVTVQIVTLLIGDTSFDNPKTLAAFALGLLLFLMTLALNVVALRITQKYREKYD